MNVRVTISPVLASVVLALFEAMVTVSSVGTTISAVIVNETSSVAPPAPLKLVVIELVPSVAVN